VREEAVFVGELFGVLSEPSEAARLLPTAVVLLNTGANHHIGSNRMYVTMARAWAERGFRVLRLDFSGVGDSLPRPGAKENDIYSRLCFEETRAALDFLGRRGATRFVLLGLCSGAYVAYHTAVADPRVSGVVLVNTATFHWKEGDSLEIKTRAPGNSTRFYTRAIFWPSTWARLLRGNIDVKTISRELLSRARARARREANEWLARLQNQDAETSDVGRGFRKLVARGTRCLLVFGSFEVGIDVVESHLGPGARRMRGEAGFRMDLVDGVDHTFTPLWSQRHLLRTVTDHLVSSFGAQR
jgi:pimeloyl-ACP methyl ester carboxylesterase